MTLDLKRYSLVLFAMVALIAAIGYALSFVDIAPPAGMSIWLPPMIAALDLGQRHGRNAGAPLAKGAAWRKALPLTGVALAIQFVFGLLALAALATQSDLALLRGIGAGWLLLGLAFALIVTYFTTVLFLNIGVKQGLKIHAREAP